MHNSHVSGRNTSSRFDNESWGEKPWKKFEKIVFRLQKGLYAARKQGNLKKVNWLQRKLLKSRSGHVPGGQEGNTAKCRQKDCRH